MSLLKLNRTKTLDSQVNLARPPCILRSNPTVLSGHCFKLSQISLAPFALRASLALALCGSLSMVTAHAADQIQTNSNGNDEYIYSETVIPQSDLSAQKTVDIDKISQNLEKGSYQPIPLQSIISLGEI